jgi:hypothetical protein
MTTVHNLPMMKQLLYHLNFVSLLGISTMLFSLPQNITITAFALPLPKSPIVENLFNDRNISHQKVHTMRSVMFNFRPDVPLEEQDALLAKINTWNGISRAARLKPNAQKAAILRMCYAYISEKAEPEVIVERLSALPEIESASIPAERRLL